MATAKGTIKATSVSGYTSNVLLGNLTTAVVNGITNSSTAVTTADKVASFSRAALAISTDTYNDSVISIDYSTNEILSE